MNPVVLIGILITIVTAIPVVAQMRKHPRGLVTLFFAEMWERFSYYGMRGLLVFYLTQHFLFDDKTAAAQYGAYTSLVYLIPLIGGVLADRWLGTRKAVAFGAGLLVAGHLMMAVEGAPAKQFLIAEGQRYEIVIQAGAPKIVLDGTPHAFGPSASGGLKIENGPEFAAASYQTVEERSPLFLGIFYLALSLIIMGVGFLKPNISTIVGQLYPQGDPRRDPGFTLYYYGINLGAFWASILCGYLGTTIGWWAGFGLAGIGMLAGLIAFILGRPSLEGHGEPPAPQALRQQVGGISRENLIYLCGFLGVGVIWLLVQRNEMVGALLTVGSILSLGYVGYFMTKMDATARGKMAMALTLIAGAVVFFTLFEQAGSSLNLFADRNTQLPGSMTAAQTQSFNAGFILIFAPAFAWLWSYLGRNGRDFDPLIKFGLGLLQVGLGFLVIVWSASLADSEYRLPVMVLAFAYLLHTTGELCLSPVGMAEVTKLSVPALVSTMMAIWFLSSSWAQYIGGFVAQMAGSETIGGKVVDPAAALANSLAVFEMIGWVGVGCGILFFVLSPLLRRWA